MDWFFDAQILRIVLNVELMLASQTSKANRAQAMSAMTIYHIFFVHRQKCCLESF